MDQQVLFMGLQEGTYTVAVTDNMGCTETIDYDMIGRAITNNFSNYIKVGVMRE